MSAWLIVGIAVAVVVGLVLGWWLPPHGRGPAKGRPSGRAADDVRRIMLPFTGTTISKRAFDAAVRLARVESAVLIPCYLAEVPLTLPLETPLPKACRSALPLLETLDTAERLQKVSLLLGKELDVLELQSKIHTAVQEEVDKSQREYLLREQMKAIQKELGEADTLTRDVTQLREKIAASGMPETVRAKAVTAGGQNGDPRSPHFADQAQRYATGALRDVHLARADVEKHATRRYRPGQKEGAHE